MVAEMMATAKALQLSIAGPCLALRGSEGAMTRAGHSLPTSSYPYPAPHLTPPTLLTPPLNSPPPPRTAPPPPPRTPPPTRAVIAMRTEYKTVHNLFYSGLILFCLSAASFFYAFHLTSTAVLNSAVVAAAMIWIFVDFRRSQVKSNRRGRGCQIGGVLSDRGRGVRGVSGGGVGSRGVSRGVRGGGVSCSVV